MQRPTRQQHPWGLSARVAFVTAALGGTLLVAPAVAQLVDRTLAPNRANEGIAKSLEQQTGAGRGSVTTPNSSLFIINRDPARAVRRGRQIFQRKFTRAQGQGPLTNDGRNIGDVTIETDPSIGAGLADSCAACHGRPRGSAGFGGDEATRPDSRDAPHLFGLGLKEMLADEITRDLRGARTSAINQARASSTAVTLPLSSKGINYGQITALPDGSVDTSHVVGVDPDLRVRPFFHHGGTISIREFVVGAFNAEMGLEAPDTDLLAARTGMVTTPAGMVLDGRLDRIEQPPVATPTEDADHDGVVNEIPVSIIDFTEFYLLNYFKAAVGETQGVEVADGRQLMVVMGCTSCHIPSLTIDRDRRVADFETVFDPARGNPFNRLFATATLLVTVMDDGSGFPPLKRPAGASFVVRNIFTDFKRHDLGPNFYELNYDGTIRREFMTSPLWGVSTTPPYGHDGRTQGLRDVILRHGGEAQAARDRFAQAGNGAQRRIEQFLGSLVIFAPDDTASTLEPAAPATPGYPQFGHGSLKLAVLFNDPTDPE